MDSVHDEQNMTSVGLLHSDIPGSKLDCSSPRLFAAYHVLHRLSMPRHPSCALSSLTTKKNFTFSCCLSTKFVPLDLAIELLRLYFKTLHSSIVNEPQVSHLPYHPEQTGSSLFHAPHNQWWAYLDLNQGPRPYQGRALTS